MGEIITIHEAAERMGCSGEEVERLILEGKIRMTRDMHGTPLVFTPLPRYRRPRSARPYARMPLQGRIALRLLLFVIALPIALGTGWDFLLTYLVITLAAGFIFWAASRSRDPA